MNAPGTYTMKVQDGVRRVKMRQVPPPGNPKEKVNS